jgi:hypothetical protein
MRRSQLDWKFFGKSVAEHACTYTSFATVPHHLLFFGDTCREVSGMLDD